jgi:hypothetical protein
MQCTWMYRHASCDQNASEIVDGRDLCQMHAETFRVRRDNARLRKFANEIREDKKYKKRVDELLSSLEDDGAEL